MEIKPKIIFRTPFYQPQLKEVKSKQELKDFLSALDYTSEHLESCYSTGKPEFQLGMRYSFMYKGEFYQSTAQLGPRFLVARDVSFDKSGHLIAEIPMDAPVVQNGIVTRQYTKTHIAPGIYAAIIDLNDFRQLYPTWRKETEMNKFFTQWEKSRLSINQQKNR